MDFNLKKLKVQKDVFVLTGKIKNEKLNEFNDFEVTIEKDIYEGINVDNCGLIIIWPFVSKLIEK